MLKVKTINRLFAFIKNEDYSEEEFALLVDIGESEIGYQTTKTGKLSVLESWQEHRSSSLNTSSKGRLTYITETLSYLLRSCVFSGPCPTYLPTPSYSLPEEELNQIKNDITVVKRLYQKHMIYDPTMLKHLGLIF